MGLILIAQGNLIYLPLGAIVSLHEIGFAIYKVTVKRSRTVNMLTYNI